MSEFEESIPLSQNCQRNRSIREKLNKHSINKKTRVQCKVGNKNKVNIDTNKLKLETKELEFSALSTKTSSSSQLFLDSETKKKTETQTSINLNIHAEVGFSKNLTKKLDETNNKCDEKKHTENAVNKDVKNEKKMKTNLLSKHHKEMLINPFSRHQSLSLKRKVPLNSNHLRNSYDFCDTNNKIMKSVPSSNKIVTNGDSSNNSIRPASKQFEQNTDSNTMPTSADISFSICDQISKDDQDLQNLSSIFSIEFTQEIELNDKLNQSNDATIIIENSDKNNDVEEIFDTTLTTTDISGCEEKKHNMSEYQPKASNNSGFNGFRFASGKNFEISEKAKQKVQNIFKDFDDLNEINMESLFCQKSSNQIQKYNANNHKQKLFDNKIINLAENSKYLSDNTQKCIEILSNTNYSGKCSNLLSNVTKNSLEKVEENVHYINSPKLTELNQQNKKKSLQHRDHDKVLEKCVDSAIEYDSICDDTSKLIRNLGFCKVSGEKIEINQSSIAKAENLFHDLDGKASYTKGFVSSPTTSINEHKLNLGTQHSKNSQHKTSHTSSTLQQKNLREITTATSIPKIQKVNSLITYPALQKQEQLKQLQQEWNKEEWELPHKQENLQEDKKSVTSISKSFANNSISSCKKSHTKRLSLSLKGKGSELSPNNGLQTPKRLEKCENEKNGLNSLRKIAIQTSTDTPDLKKFFNATKVHTSTPKHTVNTNKKESINKFKKNEKNITALKGIKQDKNMSTPQNSSHYEEMQQEPSQKTISKSLDAVLNNERVIIARNSLRTKQLHQIELKLKTPFEVNTHEIKTNISLLYWKKTLPNRIRVAKFIKEELIRSDVIVKAMKLKYILKNLKRWQKISALNISNASNFKFSLLEFEEESDYYFPLMIVNENCTMIIPNNNNEIGLNEIKNAFLAIRGVQIQLISSEWIENHYSMILLKLSTLEISYPEIFYDRLLYPNHIINQIKYRYDYEIVMKRNSCIKVLLDDYKNNNCIGITNLLKQQCILLVVLEIIRNENDTNDVEMILSDRWYYLKAKIDDEMKNLINKQKVKAGMKLLLQNFEIVQADFQQHNNQKVEKENIIHHSNYKNYDNSTVKLLKTVYLKIQTNSVRPVKDYVYNVKLGFIRNCKSISIRLDSVFENGGIISGLKLLIAHIYPTVYVRHSDRDKKCPEYFSEEVITSLYENYYGYVPKFENFESLYNQMCEEYKIEKKQNFVEKEEILKIFNDIEIVVNEENLNLALNYGYDDMTEFVMENYPHKYHLFLEYQRKYQSLIEEQIQHKTRNRIMYLYVQQNFIKILKYGVVDAKNPKNFAILSIRNPKESDKWSKLNEGSCIKIQNLCVDGYYDDCLQISNTQSTVLKIFE